MDPEGIGKVLTLSVVSEVPLRRETSSFKAGLGLEPVQSLILLEIDSYLCL